MSKAHRGKGTRTKPNQGRGTCPQCKRTGVKVIYEREVDKQKIFLCKICNTKMSKQPKPAAAAPKAEEAEA
ncbi:MAG: hypothetical protein JXD23_05210 [Spirochaetales bacterium]|nr:hypothetical protein [Spirochaetales bacterium]